MTKIKLKIIMINKMSKIKVYNSLKKTFFLNKILMIMIIYNKLIFKCYKKQLKNKNKKKNL